MNSYENISVVKNSSVTDVEHLVKEDIREQLYSSVHVVQFGLNVNKQQNVRLTIDLEARNVFLKTVLKVRVTDDNNPFFIYTLELSDEDYGHLKMMQGLLIDFSHFPSELISLLQKCSNQQEANSRFFITFEENPANCNNIDEALLKIMETNCLKLLCHLAITLTPASIGDVKEEVLLKITYLKETLHRYDNNQRESENKIQELERNINKKNREAEELRNQWDEQQKNWGLSLSKQLIEVREEYLKKYNDAVLEMKQKEDEMKFSHGKIVDQLKENLKALEIEKEYLTKSNLDLDLTIRNQSYKINNMEAKIDTLEKDLQASKYTLQEKTKDVEMKATTIKTLKTRISNTDKLFIESTKRQSALESVLDELRKEKNKLLNMLTLKEQKIQSNNDHIKTVCGDLVKANSIIRQLQRDNNISNMKLNKALQYFQEQTSKLVKCSEQLHAMKEASETKKKELDYLQKTAMSTNDTLKELKKDLLSTKKMTRIHDKEIMDLKRQPILKDYKINGQIRKQCLENVYFSRLADCEPDQTKSSRTPDENSLNVIQQDDVAAQKCTLPEVFKNSAEPVKDVKPVTHETQTNQRLAYKSEGPNVPLVDIGDEINLPEPVNKPQPIKEKPTSKPIGICRAPSNKTTDYQLASYFQKSKVKRL